MKTKLKEFAQFLFRCILSGIVILLCVGIIYSVIWCFSVILGEEPMKDFSFWYQYVQVGFWIGFFAVARDLKEFWR